MLRLPTKLERGENKKRFKGRERKHKTALTRGNMQIRVVGLAALVAIIFGILGFRLWYLQVLTGEQYTNFAQATQTRAVKIPAQRGVVYDRNGEVMANNVPGLNVTVVPASIPRERVVELTEILNADTKAVLERYEAAKESGNQYNPMLVRENASEEAVTYVSERTERFPGLVVNDDWVRKYPHGETAAHVLGYTGAVSEDELAQESFRSLTNDSIVGKGGVELQYEEALRGEPGSKEYTVDALGRQVTLRSADGSRYDGQAESIPELAQRPDRIEDPVPGNNLKLTMDFKLQELAENELEAAIQRGQTEGYNATGGAIVAMDPTNGEILAMASRPNFDPGLFVGGISGEEEMAEFEYLNSESANSPFENRVIRGAYPAASTFKVFTGMAGLAMGIITPATTVTDDGSCWRPAGVTVGCWQSWREFSGTGTTHGTQNYAEALMDSNDKFFYQVADWMWNRTNDVDLLPDFLKQFGFEKETGIDLPGEFAGRIPDSEWKKEWQEQFGGVPDAIPFGIGDWVNLAIGQGDLLVTPIQLARAYAALQNDGTLVTPHVGMEIRDQNDRLVERIAPEPTGRIDVDQRYIDDTVEGLRLVTGPNGTAASAFEDSRLDIVGKTGTGQMGENDPVGWFAGWAEDEERPLVVVAMIEGGGDGEPTAAPAVRHILEAYHGVPRSPNDLYPTLDLYADENGAPRSASGASTPGRAAGTPDNSSASTAAGLQYSQYSQGAASGAAPAASAGY